MGYGADPAAVIATIMRYAAAGAVVIKGNHEEAIERRSGYMNATLRASIEWTAEQLSSEQKTFLCTLPLLHRDGEVCLVHASADKPEAWRYVDSTAAAGDCLRATDARYTFCGHVHEQMLFAEIDARRASAFRPRSGDAISVGRHRRWLALVGSVGQPRDGQPAASYALFDQAAARIAFFRVPYDHLAAARKIRAAGLPAALAYRVQKGI